MHSLVFVVQGFADTLVIRSDHVHFILGVIFLEAPDILWGCLRQSRRLLVNSESISLRDKLFDIAGTWGYGECGGWESSWNRTLNEEEQKKSIF